MKMFPTKRSEIIENLINFSKTELLSYSNKRSFDYGPPHKNVSKISPYLRTRFISEEEVFKIVLSKNNIKTVEKFIEEIFWRTYWRGWLESHPWIYNEYVSKSIIRSSSITNVLKENSASHTDSVSVFRDFQFCS